MRAFIVVMVVVLGAACSGDDGGGAADPGGGSSAGGSSTTVDWLADVDFPAGPELDGHPTKIDEDERVIYVQDCATARKFTKEGEQYGPADGQIGYGYVCDS